ncbi:AMP-binding protein [candidate division KSB1 bacterium]|nr:AMP-binding protein [candidate division KSB1 bacterium]
MRTIVESFKIQVDERADKRAIIFNGQTITYADVNRTVNRIANGLIASGITIGDRVLLVMPNVPHFVFSYLAILQAGATVVPVNFLLNDSDLQQIIDKTTPSAIIVWDRFWPRFRDKRMVFKHIFVHGDQIPQDTKSLSELISQSVETETSIEIKLSERAVIYFTPGVTGLPKGVVLSHKNIAASVKATARLIQISVDDVFAGILPFFHVVSQHATVNTALAYGASVCIYDKSDSEHLQSALFSDGVTVLGGSPALFKLLMEQSLPDDKASTLRFAFSFGDSIEPDIIEKFENSFKLPMLHAYNVTEAGGIVSVNRFRPDYKEKTVGIPLDGMNVCIVDDEYVDMRHNKVGQLLITGDMVTERYWNDAEATTSEIHNGWIKTGDFMKIDDEGFLYFLARKDDVITKSGFQIFPDEVEKVLLLHPKVDQAAVIGISDSRYKQEVKACVILKANESATPDEIIEFCKNHIPVYKCPQIVQFYSAFPKSPTGKVLKRILRES